MYTLKQSKKRKKEKEARPEKQNNYVKVNELDDSLHGQGDANQALASTAGGWDSEQLPERENPWQLQELPMCMLSDPAVPFQEIYPIGTLS